MKPSVRDRAADAAVVGSVLAFVVSVVGMGLTLVVQNRSAMQLVELKRLAGSMPEVVHTPAKACPCSPSCKCCPCKPIE